MKGIFKYIFALLIINLMGACALDEPFEHEQNRPSSKEVEFIARPTNFIRSNVATKATSDEISAIENDIHTAYFLMYDSNGRLLRYENLTDEIKDNSQTLYQNIVTDKGMSEVTVCFVANVPEVFVTDNMTAGEGESVTDLAKFQSAVITFNNTSDLNFKIERPTSTGLVGVPSIDVHDNNKPVRCLPMLGTWTGDLNAVTGPSVEIPVKRLFVKVAFTITLDITDGSQLEEPVPTFELGSLSVSNIPEKLSLFPQESEGDLPLNGSTSDFLGSSYNKIPLTDNVKLQNKGATSFFFYVPEYIVEPVLEGNSEQGWYAQRLQQYKPQLVKVDSRTSKKATYLEIEGILTKQGQDIQLTYQIYLGENNFDSFSMKRNYLLDNYVTINGVSEGDGSIGVDHRVEVKYTGFLVSFQRATLLDSHFEVRPMRVKFSQDFIRENNKKEVKDGDLKVEILPDGNGVVPNWIRLERPPIDTDDPVYCLGGDTKYSHTKRRYFTTDLIETLGDDGISETYNPFKKLLEGGDKDGDVPIWFYIDEYTASTSADYKSDEDEGYVRRAVIRVSYTPYDGGESVSQDFTVQQRAIYPIETVDSYGQSRTYGIEYFEEYLHNYDVQDNYGVEGGEYFTSENGIPWGFDGVQLSNTDRALYFTGDAGIININELANYATEDMSLYYDYYLNRDKDSEEDKITLHDYSGYGFNQKIIEKGDIYNIDRTLAQRAESVVEYCYNKNKRNPDGTVVYKYQTQTSEATEYVHEEYYKTGSGWRTKYYTISWIYDNTTTYTYTHTNSDAMRWYAPAIDELEDIVVNGKDHEFFAEVFLDNLYWSCQPAYDRNYFQYIIGIGSVSQRSYGVYMSDNTVSARSTKYDPDSRRAKKFVSSDMDEGYYKATTLYGAVSVDNYIYTPNETDGDIVYDRISSMNGLSVAWERGEKVAVTSYKQFDGVTKIEIPDGVQKRASSHRVRCIYNPTPPSEVSELTNTVASGYVLREGSRTETQDILGGLNSSKYTSVGSLPQTPQNPPH